MAEKKSTVTPEFLAFIRAIMKQNKKSLEILAKH